MPATDHARWTADTGVLARRVDSANVGLLRSWFGGDELEVPEGVVAWVEREGGTGRVARPGDREQGDYVAVLVRDAKIVLEPPPVEIRTKEGFPAEARCAIDVAVDCVSPEGLREFARHLFVSGPEFTQRDLLCYLQPAFEAAWRAFGTAHAAGAICEGDPTERFERELRGRLRRLCFEAGLELLAVRHATVTCPDWDAIRADQVDATVEAERERHRRVLREAWLKERKNQALSQNELADFYEALEHDGTLKQLEREKEKAQAERDLAKLRSEVEHERARGELRQLDDFLQTLDGAGIRDLFERYLDLLTGRGAARRRAADHGLPADTAGLQTRRLLAVAGHQILAFDPSQPDGSGPRERFDCKRAGLGGLRSVRVLPIDGQTFLLGGAQGGCCLVPASGPHGIRALPFPGDARDRGGANAAAVAGQHLVATHSAIGVVAWDLGHPAAPGTRVLTHLTDRARTVRGVQVCDDQCWLAVDDAVYAFHAPRFPDGTPTKYRGAGAAVTALAASRTHVYAGTAEGQVVRWRIGEPDHPEPELPRRTAPVTMLRLAVVAGAPVLLAAWTGYGVIAKTLGEDSMTQYHAEHPVRWVAGGPDCVAGVDRDGHTLVVWEPSRPKARWRRFTARERMQDLWAWTEPAPEPAAEAVAGAAGPGADGLGA